MSVFCLFASLSTLFLWKFLQIYALPPICPPTPSDQLKEMLGAAYNARYMSIDKPSDLFTFTPEFATDVNHLNSSTDVWKKLSKDGTATAKNEDDSQTFHVEPTFRRLLHDKNGFSEIIKRVQAENFKKKRIILRRSVSEPKRRTLRNVSSKLLPWTCSQNVEWLDLGQDHFPRYVRSVKCTSERCFYGHYSCRPKAFTVKVLRRISDKCLELTSELREKFNLPQFSTTNFEQLDTAGDRPKFFEPWVFEEIAVNFCCECVV